MGSCKASHATVCARRGGSDGNWLDRGWARRARTRIAYRWPCQTHAAPILTPSDRRFTAELSTSRSPLPHTIGEVPMTQRLVVPPACKACRFCGHTRNVDDDVCAICGEYDESLTRSLARHLPTAASALAAVRRLARRSQSATGRIHQSARGTPLVHGDNHSVTGPLNRPVLAGLRRPPDRGGGQPQVWFESDPRDR